MDKGNPKTSKLILKNLRLQNFATFENEEIEFVDGFNSIIGETGSGKSLILDAIEIILGARADKRFVRKGAEFAVLEAHFSGIDKNIETFFDDIGHPISEGNEIVIKRLIYASDASKSFLNFQACSLGTLAQFSKRFIDLVGQFENQKLLSEDYQLLLLDNYAKLEDELESYSELYKKIQKIKEELSKKTLDETQKAQRLDYLKFQIEELERLNPSSEDEKTLLEKKSLILNWENKKKALNEMIVLLSEGESGNALSSLSRSLHQLEKDRSLLKPELIEKLMQAKMIIEETSYELSQKLDEGSDEAHKLDEIIDRLDLYQRLKKKFGTDSEGLLKVLEDYQKEFYELKNSDECILKLKKDLDEAETLAKKLALKIHEKRKVKAKELSEKLTEAVQKLRMKGATLKFELELSSILGPKGLSLISFNAETNLGDGFFKVKEIASGGELSRILLSLRQILSSHDSISIFLFDEIDTGIGGETALKIGEALKKVSLDSQVIAITHLPQIASFAEKLFHVDKKTLGEKENLRTISFVDEIEGTKKEKYLIDMSKFK